MRIFMCVLACFYILVFGYGQNNVNNPVYKFRNTGIYRIGQLECSDTGTKVKVISEYIPGESISFNKEATFLQDPTTGKKYPALSIDGTEWGTRNLTTDSAINVFYITYAPLPVGLSHINWINGTSKVCGIQLTKLPRETKLSKSYIGNWLRVDGSNEWVYGVYEDMAIIGHQFWKYTSIRHKGKTVILDLINGEQKKQLFLTLQKNGNCEIGLNKKDVELFSRQQTFKPEYKSTKKAPNTFFCNQGVAHLQGYLRGYSPDAGFSTAVFYSQNDVTGKNNPITVLFQPDGRFEADIPTDYPITKFMEIENFPFESFQFYLEPQDTLTVYMDWEDILQIDRYRNRIFTDFKEFCFMGKAAEINSSLYALKRIIPANDNRLIHNKARRETPLEFKQQQMALFEQKRKQLIALSLQRGLSGYTCHFLENDLAVSNALFLFSYANEKGYAQEIETDSSNKALMSPVTADFYNFLQQLPLDDEILFATSHFSSFVNAFKYLSPFEVAYKIAGNHTVPLKFSEYLQRQEKNLPLKEYELLYFLDTVKGHSPKAEGKINEAMKVYNKYANQNVKYSREYVYPVLVRNCLEAFHAKDSILSAYFRLSPSLTYDLTKVCQLTQNIYPTESIAETVDPIRSSVMAGISHPYLIRMEDVVYRNVYREIGDNRGYVLPVGKATDIFNKIIQQHKGKVIFVDFWATWCAPCKAGIKGMKAFREKYVNRADAAFVFITDETSPQKDYDLFMADVDGFKYRVSKDDYNYFRELFHFNGIPYYLVLDKEGRVRMETVRSWMAEQEFKKLLEE